MHEGKGKAYDKREKGKASGVKGKRERQRTGNLIRDPTRHPDRAHARTTRNDFPVRGACLKANSLPPTSDLYIYSRRSLEESTGKVLIVAFLIVAYWFLY